MYPPHSTRSTPPVRIGTAYERGRVVESKHIRAVYEKNSFEISGTLIKLTFSDSTLRRFLGRRVSRVLIPRLRAPIRLRVCQTEEGSTLTGSPISEFLNAFRLTLRRR